MPWGNEFRCPACRIVDTATFGEGWSCGALICEMLQH